MRTLVSAFVIPFIIGLGACSSDEIKKPGQEQYPISENVGSVEERVFDFSKINKNDVNYPASCENLSVAADLRNMTFRCDEDGDGNSDYAITHTIRNFKVMDSSGLAVYALDRPIFFGRDENGDGRFSDVEIYSIDYLEKPVAEKFKSDIELKTGLRPNEQLRLYHSSLQEKKQQVGDGFYHPYKMSENYLEEKTQEIEEEKFKEEILSPDSGEEDPLPVLDEMLS